MIYRMSTNISEISGENITDDMEGMVSDELYIVTSVYLSIVGITAFIGNGGVILVLVLGKPNFTKLQSVLLFSISVCDIIVACSAYPLTALSGFHKRFLLDDYACVFFGFLTYFLIMCNINALCVMAISRYVIVCRPELERYLRGKYLPWVMLCVYGYALFWTGTPLIGWSSYRLEPFKTSCTLNWHGRSAADLSYNSLCIVFCYIVPVAIYLFCYYKVARSSIFRITPVIARLRLPSGSVRYSDDMAMEQLARNAKLRSSRHMTFICLAMVTSFIIVWTPYAALTLLILVDAHMSAEVMLMPTMFAKLSCLINPIIYSVMCDRFREAASRLYSCHNRVGPFGSNRNVVEPQINIGSGDITVMMLDDQTPYNRRAQPAVAETSKQLRVQPAEDTKQQTVVEPEAICMQTS